MKQMVVVLASGLALAGCASMSDLMPNLTGPTTAELSLASEPPGSEARTSTGQTCRTPCKLMVPVNSGDFTITFSAPGRIPQVVPVAVRPSDAAGGRFDPNPAYAMLDPATPPPSAKKKGGAKRTGAVAAKKKTGSGAPRPPAAAEPPPATAAPAPANPPGSPWPPPPR
jgi:hypothetical protein